MIWTISTNAYAEKLKILVSINPIYSLTKNITGDLDTVDLLVPPNASPHNYQLRPSDINKLREADLIIIIDDSFEVFLSKYLSRNTLKSKVIRLGKTKNLITLPARNIKVLNLEEHHHDHDHSHDHHHGLNLDMHIWTDIINAQVIVKRISSELAKLDRKNSSEYYENANKTNKRLSALNKEMQNILNKTANKKPFIVFHDAYQYLEKKYNLKNAGAVSGNNFIYGPKTMKKLKNNIEKYKIKCIFAEPQFSDTLLRKVAKNTGTNINYLDIEGGTFGFNLKPEEVYFFMMRKNAENIRDCVSSD